MTEVDYGERALRFDAGLARAESCADADGVLAGMLVDPEYDEAERRRIASALGDVRGPEGSAVLRAALFGAIVQLSSESSHRRSALSDLAGTCLWALGKRDGAAATDALVMAVDSPHRDVSVSGMQVLAAVGDDRAWDEMADELARAARGKSVLRSRDAASRLTMEYLARHAPTGSERAVQLVGLIRDLWEKIDVDSRTVIESWWPGIEPGGPAPDVVDLDTRIPGPPWELPPAAETTPRPGGSANADGDGQ